MSGIATTFTSEEGSNQKRQKTEENPNTIVIKFTNNKNDQPFYCTVKKTIPFRRIFQIYCQHTSLDDNSARFLYEDHKLLPNLTPEDVNFPDGGEIDVMAELGGGGCNQLVLHY